MARYCGKHVYDVFLSFRGEDTRTGFTSHLNTALTRAGIITFMDNKLERGKEISESLLEAIECSRYSIVILSTNYADSRWCMEELEKIMQCKRSFNQKVLPVFYHVDPSHVRKQGGPFGKSFANLLKRVSATEVVVMNWRQALKNAGELSGWTVELRYSELSFIDELI